MHTFLLVSGFSILYKRISCVTLKFRKGLHKYGHLHGQKLQIRSIESGCEIIQQGGSRSKFLIPFIENEL